MRPAHPLRSSSWFDAKCKMRHVGCNPPSIFRVVTQICRFGKWRNDTLCSIQCTGSCRYAHACDANVFNRLFEYLHSRNSGFCRTSLSNCMRARSWLIHLQDMGPLPTSLPPKKFFGRYVYLLTLLVFDVVCCLNPKPLPSSTGSIQSFWKSESRG
jgi:hypothetical protein